jgi:aspartyl-tRNA synthetase
MLKRLKFRAEFIDKIREFMKNNEFLEVQTPILTVSSPEGARDFIVPSRLHKGKFYALPQAPQIFKQLLMVGGINKYFQIAPCFRDEDARKDRCYGEFYQLDFEVSFVEKDDAIIDILTNLMKYVLEFFGKKPIFSVMTYEESMDKYGTDKPNLNNELFLEDFTKVFANSQMDLFRKKIENGEIVKGVRVHGLEKAACDKVLAFTETKGFKTAYVTKINGEIKGPIGKFVSNDICQENETIFFVLNEKNQARKNAGLIIKYFEKKENENFHIVFVKDFPFFEWNAEENKWEFTHNPFSMPKTENLKEENIYAYQYDMVLNGYELASGSVRNYKPNLLIEAFKKCGYLEEDVKKKFCSLINAFQYGVPPHAGAAIGIDRLIMILLNAKNTREVIAFPLNTNGVCPMMNAPSEIDEKLLKDLNIILKK